MGSCISQIEDQANDYLWFCEQIKVKPKDPYNFDDHMKELVVKYPKAPLPAGSFIGYYGELQEKARRKNVQKSI